MKRRKFIGSLIAIAVVPKSAMPDLRPEVQADIMMTDVQDIPHLDDVIAEICKMMAQDLANHIDEQLLAQLREESVGLGCTDEAYEFTG